MPSPGGHPDGDPDHGTGEPGPRESGTVRWFDERRGYGFIARPAAIDVFFHGSAVAAPRPLAAGDRVTFEVADAPRGLQARAVRLADLAGDGTSGEPAP
jgi:CspA family cold shock protein